MNLFYTIIDATYNSNDYSNKGFNYTGKLNMNYRTAKDYSFQLSGNYESPKVIPQGNSCAQYFADCGISKDIHKFSTFTLSVNDIFNTKRKITHLQTDQYIQDS